MDEKNSVYIKARCIFHIVFVSKFSRRFIFRKLEKDIGNIFRSLCEKMNVELIEMKSYSGRIHLLVFLPPKLNLTEFMLFLKKETTNYIFKINSNPKYLDGKSKFWGKNYFVTMVERDRKSKFMKIRD